MDKLDLGDLTLNDEHLTHVELYGTRRGYNSIQTHDPGLTILDKITAFKIRGAETSTQTPLFYDTLIERTILKGVQGQHLSHKVVSDLMLKLIYETEGEGEFNPGTRFKPEAYPGLVGQEFQFEYAPREAIELTRQFREALPNEIISNFTSYAKKAP